MGLQRVVHNWALITTGVPAPELVPLPTLYKLHLKLNSPCLFWTSLYLTWLIYSLDFCSDRSQSTWSAQEEIHSGLWTEPGCPWLILFFCPTVVSQRHQGGLQISLSPWGTPSLGHIFDGQGCKSYWHLQRKIEEENTKVKTWPGRKVVGFLVFFFWDLFFFFVIFLSYAHVKCLLDDDFVWFLGSPGAAAAGSDLVHCSPLF